MRFKKSLLVGMSAVMISTWISGCGSQGKESDIQSRDKEVVQEDKKQGNESQEAHKQENDGQEAMSFTEEIQEEKAFNNTMEEDEEPSHEEKFVGKVGDYPIHMTLDFEKKKGSYSYDHIGQPIPLTIFIDREENQKNVFYLNEEGGELYLYAYSKDSFYGLWHPAEKERELSSYLEVSLQREGTKEELPPKSAEAKAFEGIWYGKRNSYFDDSTIWVYPIKDKLIYYRGQSFSGANIGSWRGFAIKNDALDERVYERVEDFYYGERPVYFKWHLEGEQLEVETETSDWGCGSGVSFDQCYLKEEPALMLPTAQEVGIADNEEEEALFRKLVQGYYEDFINYTRTVNYWEDWLNDTEKVLCGNSRMKSWNSICYYMKTKDKMYVAVDDFTIIHYFTNDERYQSQVPKQMAEWATLRKKQIEYNYVP